jgi:molybdopterin converting factor small subunit
MRIKVVSTGRGYDQTEDLPEQLEVPDGASLDVVLAAINDKLPQDQPLADSCLIVVDNRHVGTLAQHDPVSLSDGSELMLIAPVAGG